MNKYRRKSLNITNILLNIKAVKFAVLCLIFTACFDTTSSMNTSLKKPKFWPLKIRAVKGKDFIRKMNRLSAVQKENEIFRNVVNGNVPSFLKRFKRVRLSTRLKNGRIANGTIYVMADYMAVGTDKDYVRVPMIPSTARKISESLNCILPTTKMVDEIYRQASIKLSPSPMKPGPKMTSVKYFDDHNRKINSQLRGENVDVLIAGHKKDIVISTKLMKKRNRVAIYGWHRKNGRPIQPLSTVHGHRYVDYSHGVRLVWSYMEVNGKRRKVSDVLADPLYASLISYEGPIRKGSNLLVENKVYSEILGESF